MIKRRLYNRDFAKQRGREKRLDAELNAYKHGEPVPSVPPLFSHDATLQSYFNKAWHRVNPTDIQRHIFESKSHR